MPPHQSHSSAAKYKSLIPARPYRPTNDKDLHADDARVRCCFDLLELIAYILGALLCSASAIDGGVLYADGRASYQCGQ